MTVKCEKRAEIRLDPAKVAKLLFMGLELERLRKLFINAGRTFAAEQRHFVVTHLNNASSYLNHTKLAGMFHLRQAAIGVGSSSSR